MKLPHFIAMTELGVGYNPSNIYSEDSEQYRVDVAGGASSIIPKGRVDFQLSKTVALLKKYPSNPFPPRRFALLVEDLSSDELEVITNLITSMTPYKFHFDLFLSEKCDREFYYNLDLPNTSYYLHSMSQGMDIVFGYMENVDDAINGVDFVSYLDVYHPEFVFVIDFQAMVSVTKYLKVAPPDTRFLAYLPSEGFVGANPREILFSEKINIDKLELIDNHELLYVGVENDEVKAVLKTLLESKKRIFTLPTPGKKTKTYHGYVEGKSGVLVFPDNEGGVSETTADMLSALGLPTTFVFTNDSVVNLGNVKETFDNALLSNFNILGPVPDKYLPGVITSARAIFAENYDVPEDYLKLCDGQIVYCRLEHEPDNEKYEVVPIIISTDGDDFDESCEKIEEAYGDIATVLTTKEEVNALLALEHWFYWMYGKDGLAML